MKTDVTARFSKQIMEAINEPVCLLYYVYDEEEKLPTVVKLAYSLGSKIMAEGTHYDEDLNESLPRFPVKLDVYPMDTNIRIYTI